MWHGNPNRSPRFIEMPADYRAEQIKKTNWLVEQMEANHGSQHLIAVFRKRLQRLESPERLTLAV